jgi:hypothetical protein
VATPAETVRALTGLTADELPDATITGLLDAHDGNVKAAAADALAQTAERLASVVATDDVRIDDTKRAAAMQTRSQRLSAEAADDADTGFFFGTTLGERCGAELTERGWSW